MVESLGSVERGIMEGGGNQSRWTVQVQVIDYAGLVNIDAGAFFNWGGGKIIWGAHRGPKIAERGP